jgi:hypothetical protein
MPSGVDEFWGSACRIYRMKERRKKVSAMKIAISQTHRTDHRRCSRLGIDPSGKGANSCDSFSLQKERHPGAGCFIGSRAVEDDISMARDFLVTMLNSSKAMRRAPGIIIGRGLPGSCHSRRSAGGRRGRKAAPLDRDGHRGRSRGVS